MSKFTVLFLAIVAATFAVTSAITPEQKEAIKTAALPLLQSCRQEFGISKEDVLAAKESKNIDALNPCYYACFFKNIGFINEEGLFDAAVAKQKNSKYLTSEDDLKKTFEIADACTSVNEQAVSDGAKGCERAKLLLSCFVKEKAALSLFSV